MSKRSISEKERIIGPELVMIGLKKKEKPRKGF